MSYEEASGSGWILVQIDAFHEGEAGTVHVRITKGSNGPTQREAMASVSRDSGVPHAHIALPIVEGEGFHIQQLGGTGNPQPTYKTVYFPHNALV
ncbi:MAG: hypothetical protein ACPG31_10265 [Planctomycetota bacterium]